jgi:hypothetical protein
MPFSLLLAFNSPQWLAPFEPFVPPQTWNIMLEQSAHTQVHADATWRRAVETTLQQLEIITISEPKTVTQFP